MNTHNFFSQFDPLHKSTMRMFFTKTLSLFALLHFLIYASLVAHVACGPSTPSTGTGDTGGTKASKNVKLDCPEIKALNTSGHWNKERYFIEPLLHECLRRNPVDISQLPAIVCCFYSYWESQLLHVYAYTGLYCCGLIAGRKVFAAETRVWLQLQLSREIR